MITNRDQYMLCNDCGFAVKKSKMFIKSYRNTAFCLCNKCASALSEEIQDQVVDRRTSNNGKEKDLSLHMTKKDFWLKLFSENDTALASAIHLCERFVTDEQLERGADFIKEKIKELDEEVPEEQILEVFGSQKR